MTTIETTYADPVQLAEWLRSAAPGHQAIYAKGPGLNPDNATVQLVARWIAARDVLPHMQRVAGVLTYVVKRRGADTAAAPAPKACGGRSARRWPENAAERALLEYIEGLAADGLPLPTNAAIADVLASDCRDLQDKDQVRYRLRQLQAAGFVTVADVEGSGLTPGTARARRATICDTGAMTAGLVGAGAGRANDRERVA